MAAKICLKPLGQEEVPKLVNVLKGFLPDSIVVKMIQIGGYFVT
jgi:hypothetical protein